MSSHRKYSLNPNSRRKRRDQLNGFKLWHYGPTWGPRKKTQEEIEEEKKQEAYEKAFKNWVNYLKSKGDNLSFQDIFKAPFIVDKYSDEYVYSQHFLLNADRLADQGTDQVTAVNSQKSVEEKELIKKYGEDVFTFPIMTFSSLDYDYKDYKYYRYRKILQDDIIWMLNNPDKKLSSEFILKQINRDCVKKYFDNSDCYFVIYKHNMKFRFDVRCWGFMMKLNLSNEKAGKLQEDFVNYCVDLITK